MAEKMYRIGEAAELLNLKTYVLRFWETEFPQLAPLRTDHGQRLYSEEHITLLRRIKQLLHEQGMTIDGARRVLSGSAVVDQSLPERVVAVPDKAFIGLLKQELSALRRILAGHPEERS
ncbi:MAG: MerR family transcriptional regulator [Desulfovibrio sp.]|nr:MerR family transcriptional regulator [Desulfovibrio sp.]